MAKIFLITFIVIVLEMSLIIYAMSSYSFFGTIAFCILTSVAGVFLIKKGGLLALLNIQKSIIELKSPEDELIKGGLTLIGGILLIIPGFITDFAGLLLFIPPSRQYFFKIFKAGIQKMLKNKIRVVNVRTVEDGEEKEVDVIDVK